MIWAFCHLVRRSHVVISDFSDFDVTNLCWALARAGEVDRELFEALAEHTAAGHQAVARDSDRDLDL